MLSSYWERMFNLLELNESEKEWILNKFFIYK
jgi:hypothetical protein